MTKGDKPLRLGKAKAEPTKPEPAKPATVAVLADEAIDTATLKELRAAYRELRAWRQNHRCEELIGERTEEALRRTREEGKKTGGHVPLGFDAGEDLVLQPNKRERQIMKIAKQQRDQGKSLRAIAYYLEERGFLSRNNKKFEAAQVKRLVERATTLLTTE
jgi:DNA invertase Pin-like site-specific DNA recombinase